MPLVAHNQLPTFQRLAEEGLRVLPTDRALHQDIRELHIGVLNMMPDAALAATERQFFRLVGQSNPVAQLYMHPFSLPHFERSEQAQAHIDKYYETFDQVREQGVDALIITGANVVGSNLSDQPFWAPLKEVIAWAEDNVTSVLCSCLATHAVMEFRYGQKRVPRPVKTWGVFPHHVVEARHPLVQDGNTRFDVPHSRWNNVSRAQFEEAGNRVLAESDVGVHLAVSEEGLKYVFFQGHPEYDTVSLLKEYKRDLLAHAKSPDEVPLPPFPDHYLNRHQQAILREYSAQLCSAIDSGRDRPDFPEALLVPGLDNTWRDSAEAVVGKWIGAVYAVTHHDRSKPLMDHLDPANPLGIDW